MTACCKMTIASILACCCLPGGLRRRWNSFRVKKNGPVEISSNRTCGSAVSGKERKNSNSTREGQVGQAEECTAERQSGDCSTWAHRADHINWQLQLRLGQWDCLLMITSIRSHRPFTDHCPKEICPSAGNKQGVWLLLLLLRTHLLAGKVC